MVCTANTTLYLHSIAGRSRARFDSTLTTQTHTQTQHGDTARNTHTQIQNHFRTNTQAHSQGKDFTPIVASQPNATVVVETKHGDTALCGCMLALRRQLSLRARAKALLKDLKGPNELLLSRSFLVGDAITAADVAAVASFNDPVNSFLTAAERAAVPNVMRGGSTPSAASRSS